MSFLEIIGYLGALLIGLVMGLTGSGGSILSVPILAYLFKYDEKTATAYSLFIVGMTAIVGSWRIFKYGENSTRLIWYFGLPAIVGILLSRRVILPMLPEELFHVFGYYVSRRMFIFGLFGAMMLLASYTMLHKTDLKLSDLDVKEDIPFHPLILTEGLFLGVVMGLVGAGGGFLMVPALMLIANLSIKKAVGTSLIIVCMNSLTGFFLGDFFFMEIDWSFLFRFVLLSFVGIILGGYLVKFIDSERLKKGFAYFILAMALFIFVMEFLIH